MEEKRKGENELSMAVEILRIVSNLDDADEAIEYTRLYMKAQKEALKVAGEEHSFEEKEVFKLIAETDNRFEEVKKMISISKILEELAGMETGRSLKLLVWKDGSTGLAIGDGYTGEQDGDDPILILYRDLFGNLEGWEGNADLWDALEDEIEDAGGNSTREEVSK